MILSAEDLSYSYGDRLLFENITFNVEEGDKYGIIGVNGTGKSTLLRMIANHEAGDGKLTIPGGVVMEYLPQDPPFEADATVLEQVFKGDSPLMVLLRDYETAVEQAAAEPDNKKLQKHLLDLQQQMDDKYAWQLESEAKAVLTQLGITNLQQHMGELSGGQRKRVALAGVLVRPSDLLILDEPTNHMDNATVAWLEQKLLARKGALLMVTHDRYFFDRVVNRTLEIDGGKGYVYVGNYSLFLQKREERRIAEASAAQKLRNIYRRELAWISRGAEARRTKKKDRVERFAQIEAEVKNVKTEANLEMSSVSSRLGKTIIELEDIGMVWDGKDYIKDFSYILLRNDRIGIVGPNGAGKSTLFKLLTGLLTPQTGVIKIDGENFNDLKPVEKLLKVGITFQNPDDQLFNPTVQREVEWSVAQVMDDHDTITRRALAALKRVGLDDKTAESPYDLSLSERKLLSVATVLAVDPAIYLFDEPMMSLDWESRRKLTAIFHELADSGHQVVTITHDMDWVAAEFESVYVMEHGKFGFAGSPRELFSDHELVQRVGLLPPRIMDIAESMGDSQTYLSVDDYCQKNRDV